MPAPCAIITADDLPFKGVWQLKEGQLNPKEIKEEVQKPGVKQALMEGFGYTVVSSGRHSDKRMNDHRALLQQEAEQVLSNFPDCPKPFTRILYPEDLAAWAQVYPGVVMHLKHQQVAHHLVHLETWAKPLLCDVPEFFWFSGRQEAMESIQQHVELKNTVEHPLLSVASPPSSGASRLVYEALKATKGIEDTVICLEDPQELQYTVNYLRNHAELKAILVVERCSLKTAHSMHPQYPTVLSGRKKARLVQ